MRVAKRGFAASSFPEYAIKIRSPFVTFIALTFPAAGLVHTGRESLIPGGLSSLDATDLGISRRVLSFVGHATAGSGIRTIHNFFTAFQPLAKLALRYVIIPQRLAGVLFAAAKTQEFVHQLGDVWFTT